MCYEIIVKIEVIHDQKVGNQLERDDLATAGVEQLLNTFKPLSPVAPDACQCELELEKWEDRWALADGRHLVVPEGYDLRLNQPSLVAHVADELTL